MTSIKNLLLKTHLNQTKIALNPTSMFQSLSLLPYTGLLGIWLTLTVHHLLLSNASEFSSVEKAKHKVSKLVHIYKCEFYTERIALASSSKELHQIVNTLSNRHPPKILQTIYPSADLPSIFIKHFTNKVEKLRANIASEHVTSTLVTGTTTATFSSFEKVSQSTVKECIHNSAPKSHDLDPIPSKLLIDCQDSFMPSLTDLFNSSLASSHNASNQPLSHLFSKRGVLITIILTIISLSLIYALLLKYWKTCTQMFFLPQHTQSLQFFSISMSSWSQH